MSYTCDIEFHSKSLSNLDKAVSKDLVSRLNNSKVRLAEGISNDGYLDDPSDVISDWIKAHKLTISYRFVDSNNVNKVISFIDGVKVD